MLKKWIRFDPVCTTDVMTPCIPATLSGSSLSSSSSSSSSLSSSSSSSCPVFKQNKAKFLLGHVVYRISNLNTETATVMFLLIKCDKKFRLHGRRSKGKEKESNYNHCSAWKATQLIGRNVFDCFHTKAKRRRLGAQEICTNPYRWLSYWVKTRDTNVVAPPEGVRYTKQVYLVLIS